MNCKPEKLGWIRYLTPTILFRCSHVHLTSCIMPYTARYDFRPAKGILRRLARPVDNVLSSDATPENAVALTYCFLILYIVGGLTFRVSLSTVHFPTGRGHRLPRNCPDSPRVLKHHASGFAAYGIDCHIRPGCSCVMLLTLSNRFVFCDRAVNLAKQLITTSFWLCG